MSARFLLEIIGADLAKGGGVRAPAAAGKISRRLKMMVGQQRTQAPGRACADIAMARCSMDLGSRFHGSAISGMRSASGLDSKLFDLSVTLLQRPCHLFFGRPNRLACNNLNCYGENRSKSFVAACGIGLSRSWDALREAPNPKLQAPKKLRIPSSKLRIRCFFGNWGLGVPAIWAGARAPRSRARRAGSRA